LASNPADPELRFLKGVIFAEQGKNDEAIEIFAALTRDYPELPEPYNNLAVLFAEKGEFEKAREALLAAIQTHPSYSTAHENLGDLYAKMASMAYDRALEEDKSNESARIKLAQVNALFSVPHSRVAAAAASDPAAATPAQAEPASESPPEPAMNQTSDVDAAVERWRTAWTARDVQAYVNTYADDYAPHGMTHDAWTAQQRERLTTASFVKVSVDDLHVAFPHADMAKAEFTQGYQADNYKDRVHKTLTLLHTDSGWRIVREDSQPL
jgi:ketosteroid isomerase-like protein